MNETSKFDLTWEEAVALDAQMEELLAAMRKANEQMVRDQEEFEVLQAETRAILARLKERQYVETSA